MEFDNLPEGWNDLKLGSLCKVSSSKRIFSREYVDSGIPFYRSKEIIEKANQQQISSPLYISRERFNEIKSKYDVPEEGNILITSVGTIGIPYIVKENEEFYFKDGNLTILNNYKKNTISHFLYYWINSKKTQEQIDSVLIGTTQKALTIQNLKNLKIKLPTLREQQKIALILSAFDDKIELNNQINKNLEDMAQALFKSWFVDFEPFLDGEFEESELGMIPKGWSVDTIGNISNVITGKTPSTRQTENYGGKYKFITIPDMHNNIFIIKTERSLSEIGNQAQPKKLIPENSLIVSCIATVGLVSIVSEPSHTNQQINSVVCKDTLLYYLYSFFKLYAEDLKQLGSAGTATLNVNKTTFEGIKVILPTINMLEEYTNKVKPFFEQIKINTLQNQTLSKQRDTLLPKLMSGEIRV